MPEETILELVKANVFGLGYIRSMDDLKDGDVEEAKSEGVRSLAKLLYREARVTFQRLLGSHPWFWGRYRSLIRRWWLSGVHLESRSISLKAKEERMLLAEVGAPLLIGPAAVCALGGVEHEYRALSRPVEHYLVACVLMDHLKDWEEDLRAGRSNLFNRAATGGRSWESVELSREHVYQELYGGSTLHDYFGLALDHLRQASAAAKEVDSLQQAEYLEAFYQHCVERRNSIQRKTAVELRRAAEILLVDL